MKSIKKYVYYCDFCKKKGLRKDAIVNHEKNCTANPLRYCKLCENSTELTEDIVYFKSRFKIVKSKSTPLDNMFDFESDKIEWIGKETTMDELRRRYDDCPACILSILRQTGMNLYPFQFEFDYMKESKEYFDGKIRDKQQEQYY